MYIWFISEDTRWYKKKRHQKLDESMAKSFVIVIVLNAR